MSNRPESDDIESMANEAIDLTTLEHDEYGFPGPMRDSLVEAILEGRKTRTTSLLAEYQHDHEPLPQVGKLSVVIDSEDKPVCVTRLMEVKVCNISDITDEHARGEGEDYDDAVGWRKAHEQFWEGPEFLEELGDRNFKINDDTKVVCERFSVVKRL